MANEGSGAQDQSSRGAGTWREGPFGATVMSLGEADAARHQWLL